MKTSTVISQDLLDELQDVATIGVDIGSRTGKAALLTKDELSLAITATSIDMQQTADYLIEKVLKQAGLGISDISHVVGTGYGRIAFKSDDVPIRIVTEISCHGLGAHYLNSSTETIIDIGGQDSKAIKIDRENGKVVDFIMNDKCAAGTGRFLERVAELLDVSLEESGELSLSSKGGQEISSQCVVFAESEIITLKTKGAPKEDILNAVNLASARRVRNLVNRIGLKPEMVFSGGVSQNPGMKAALEQVIGHGFTNTNLDMTYNGALGAAIFAQKYYLGTES
ncbi:MAG: acyl-CoA dehydratase activase [Synergistaceae bacterium]|jgi:predicted CoA-substrate-specific enzyme activase|nr:acyl-CoA dehydratase activase [Synergistaceae bacterium]